VKLAPLLQACLILILVVIGYWPALRGLFIWDDSTFISDNDLVRSPNGLFNIWFTRDATDYWPLTYSVFWLMWRAFGSETFWYHAANIAVHVCNALLVWRILTRLGLRWAYAAALIFAVHPVAVESVAWIFQLKTTLAAFFALGSVFFWIRYLEGSRRRAYEYSLFLMACALLTKTSVVTWPLALLGATWWKKGRLAKKDWLALSPFFVLSLIAGTAGLYWYEYDQLLGSERVRVESFGERVLSSGYAFWFYIWKGIVPFNLSFMYPRWQITGAPGDYLPVLAVVAVFALLIWLKSRVRYAFDYFLITIFPVLGFADIYYMRFSYVADHWQYLSLIGTICIVVAMLDRWRWVPFALVPGLLFLTMRQSALYTNEETLWRDTLAKNPHAWVAENGLGLILLQSGRRDEAVAHFKKLIADKPEYVDPYINMGTYYLGQSEDSEASVYFAQALKVFPHNARASNNMAALALRHGEPDVALHYLEDAVAYLPTYEMGFKNLGIVYARLGRNDEAFAAFEKALQLRSDDEEARVNLRALGSK
jgi:tetratricopeptide (TPR) repeat protein